MIYPTINIEPDQTMVVNIYDTEFDSSPVMSIQDVSGEAFQSFYTLLTLFLNQYTTGFEEGYDAGYGDCFDEFDDDYPLT